MIGGPIPRAPAELDLADRLAWRAGYRRALDDLLSIESLGGELRVNGELVFQVDRPDLENEYRPPVGRHVIE